MPPARGIAIVIISAALSVDGSVTAGGDMPKVAIDRNRVDVSGISSGAYMAGQMHVAFSKTFRGAALLAGGPYWCS